MDIVTLLLFIFIGVGITNIIVNALILEKIRVFISNKNSYFKSLLSCMMCCGFWVGLILSINYDNISYISGGAIISLYSYIYSYIMDLLDLLKDWLLSQIEYEDIEDEE